MSRVHAAEVRAGGAARLLLARRQVPLRGRRGREQEQREEGEGGGGERSAMGGGHRCVEDKLSERSGYKTILYHLLRRSAFVMFLRTEFPWCYGF